MNRAIAVLGLVLPPLLANCQTSNHASKTKDIQSVEQTPQLTVEQAIYYIANGKVFRAVCPGLLAQTGGNGNARSACTVITAQAPVDSFRTTMTNAYHRQFGVFGQAESDELEKLIKIMSTPSQTFIIQAGGLGQKFMSLMDAVVLAAPDGPPSNDPSTNGTIAVDPTTNTDPTTDGNSGQDGGQPLPQPPASDVGLLAASPATVVDASAPSTLTVNGLRGRQLDKIRVELNAGCPFQTSGVAVGFGGLLPESFTDDNTNENASSTMWGGAPVRAQRIFVSFTGQPGRCNVKIYDGEQSPGDTNSGGGTTSGPLTVVAIYSTQAILGNLQPNKSHTFAFFAQLDQNGQITDYVPISWLPVLTTDPTGQTTGTVVPDQSGALQVGPIRTLVGQPRLGWDFSMTATEGFIRAHGTVLNRPVQPAGVYIVSSEFFAQAKAWRDQLNANARSFINSGNLGSRFMYLADDRDNYPEDCTNPQPDALNCFHAFSALANDCLHTGIASGVSATQRVIGLLQQLSIIRQNPTGLAGDPMALFTKAKAFEAANGPFDAP